jgi:hypothetical protein
MFNGPSKNWNGDGCRAPTPTPMQSDRRMNTNSSITAEELQRILEYLAETGRWFWRITIGSRAQAGGRSCAHLRRGRSPQNTDPQTSLPRIPLSISVHDWSLAER